MEIEYGNLSKIMVTMELWENQNFWPIKGWRCPLGISQFQVHFTDKTLNSNNFPNIPLPSEWKWSNEWSVDKSRNFGSPDSDGWVYGPTFDRISQNVISLTATGTASSLCLCRKRRWSRSMICSSASILQGVLHRVNHIKSERMKIQQFMIDKSSCVEQLKPFEDKRRTADQTAFHSILRPFSIIDNRLNSEMSTLNKMLLVVAVDSDFACEISAYLERTSVIYGHAHEEYQQRRHTWNKLNRISTLFEATHKHILQASNDAHVGDVALLSHELNFLQGAGCIGDVLPSSVRHKNLRQRQISWDIPDLGDIWYCVKKYRQSVLVMQELLLDSVYEGQELFEEVKASEGTYTSLLSKFKTLYPMEYSKLDAHTPLTELYSTLISNWTGLGYSDISEKTMELRMSLCPQESMIHFDENSLPKLPPTLGKFTVMIASAAQVRRCASQHCAPTEEQLQHARASTVRGVHVNVEAIEWREVIAVISTDGFLHALRTVEDYDIAMPVQSIPLKGSYVGPARTALGPLPNCIEIYPWVAPAIYILFHRLLGRKISRHTDGVVVCLASQEQAQLMLDILQGNFTAHKPVTTHDIDPVSGVTGIVSEHINDVDDTILSGIDASSMSYDQVEAAVRAKIGLGTSHTPQVLSDGRTKISSNLASKAESTTFDVSEVTMELTRQSRVMSEAPPLAVLSLLSPSSSSLVSEESALNSLLPTQKGSWKDSVPKGAVFEDEFFEMDHFPVRFRGKGGVAKLTEEEKQERMSISGRNSEYIKRYADGLVQSFERIQTRVKDVKAQTQSSLPSDVDLSKVSEAFRVKQPRSVVVRPGDQSDSGTPR